MSSRFFELDLCLVPSFTFTFVEDYIKSSSKASGDKKISKGFKYYSEHYIFGIKVQASSDDETTIEARCFKSQKKKETPYKCEVTFNRSRLSVVTAVCTCPIGLGGSCGHVCGLLYQLAKYKLLGLRVIPEDIAKTSLPQAWHIPRGQQIEPSLVDTLAVQGYKTRDGDKEPRPIKSTLYYPLNQSETPGTSGLLEDLERNNPDCQAIPILKNPVTEYVSTRFGKFPKGSPLSYQQRLSSNYICNVVCPYEPPKLPLRNVMQNNYNAVLDRDSLLKFEDLKVTLETIHKFEEKTKLQSASSLWYKIRSSRITASKIGKVYSRVRADPIKLAENLRKRTAQTEAMKQGIANEPLAAETYANTVKQGSVNIYPCGVVVSFGAPWLAASPDRIVYDPGRAPTYGLLEIKCTVKSSVREVEYVKVNANGSVCLKTNHNYYYQVITQLAVTGMEWCDFFIWSQNDYHIETIYFDYNKWQTLKDKVDQFFFEYFL